jgi:hypothetical protein
MNRERMMRYMILDENDLNYQGLKKWKEDLRIGLDDLRLSPDTINQAAYIFLIKQDGCLEILKNKYPIK